MARRALLVCVALSLPPVAGCHFFDDPEDIEECPVGSHYPCPCDATQKGGFCDDGTTCIYPTGSADAYGMCSQSCGQSYLGDTNSNVNDYMCEDPPGYGTREYNGSRGSACFWNVSDYNNQVSRWYCAVVCQSDDECPPGMICPYDDGAYDFGICAPD